MNDHSELKTAIRRLTIPMLWIRLGLPGTVRPQCCIRSPVRDDDRNPSFFDLRERHALKRSRHRRGGRCVRLLQSGHEDHRR
jgi:hypothetical protein